MNKTAHSRKMLLKVCFTTFWCHIKHKNSRYEIRETFFEECLEFCLKVAHTTLIILHMPNLQLKVVLKTGLP